MITEIPRNTWRRLFQGSSELYKMAPWKVMGDQHIFGMVDPVTGQKCYGTVMGHMGSYFAFALYRGKAGYKSMLELLTEEESSDPESALYEQDCLMVAFEKEEEADGEDIALMESQAKDLVDIDRIPGFRSYRQAMMPWVIDEAEAAVMEAGMKLCMRVAYHLQEDGTYLTPSEEDKGKLRFFRESNGEWEEKWEETDSLMDFSPPRLEVSQESLKIARELPSGENIWLFERFYFRQPSMDETSDRPYFPAMFVLLNLETQIICGMDLVRPQVLVQEGGDILLELFQEAGEKPAALVVSRKENYILLHPLGRALGLEIHLDEDLDVLPDIKASLYAQMEQEG